MENRIEYLYESAKPGQIFMIKKASSWERFRGWLDYYWGKYRFISFENSEVKLHKDGDPTQNLYLSHRNVKTGEAKILESKSV